MLPKAAHITPLLHVADIERSMRYYEILGFETVNTDRSEHPRWARMQCEGGALMLAYDESIAVSPNQSVIFYMYTADLPTFREHLLSKEVRVSPIRYPEYMPSGEIAMKDPDGYVVLVCHWGEKEDSQWLKRVGKR